ncbi:SusD/RagB family nutrient-binding outer membrane lipoprotein [Cellulophaga fucicola]|uniref:Starch-binding associating with outer membrane n=1 Tax=Cellulophaga fucicola TaxID=76595 RepID=A0A1K1P450_9FLAO|nr:SusD/RagB family nutrient-binding outer membrane lipoprotein [Cellulophaga fucicola]SFW41470.1 Starch-binding associating with outer membrane [Cellulophaga fucicola]
MKKNKIFTLLLSATMFCACDNGLEELNIDPNNAVIVSPSTLLTTAEYTFYNSLAGTGINAGWGMLMTQQWSENEYTEDSRYNQTITAFDGTWSAMYASVLKELDSAKDLVDLQDVSDEIKTNKKNILDVMSSQVFTFLSDGFGAVPYTEAINSDFNLPTYDSQETIYLGVLESLEQASNTFNTGSPSFNSGDVVYGGNVENWIKLTNSLMLKYAIRLSDIDLATATKYATIASANLISSNAENALFTFDSAPDRSNPLWRNVNINNRDDYAVSEYLVTTLTDLGDPRLDVYAKPASAGSIVGMPYGLSDNDATILKPTTSRPSDLVRSATSSHLIMSYSEVQFLLAEAYQRGILTGDAETAYNNAVTASMNYWGIDDAAAISDYLTNNAYDTANWKESIGIQKWVSLYVKGFEAWNEWRRLDYPQLSAPAAAFINTIPVRMPYPLSETTSNSASLNAVSSNPADMTEKVWWDVN